MNEFKNEQYTSITISDSEGTISNTFQPGPTWMELTEAFLRLLLGKGFGFSVEAVMEGVEEAHDNWLRREHEFSRKIDFEEDEE